MDIRSEILREHSKSQVLKIAGYIGSDRERFGALMLLSLEGEYRTAQRASWTISYCAEKHPELVTPYLERMVDNLDKPVHNAVKRNTVRILQFMDIPAHLLGKVVTVCFSLLLSKDGPVAVKVFSMTVLCNACKRETELANELRLVIEEQLPYSTPGFASRAGKVLKELNKSYSAR